MKRLAPLFVASVLLGGCCGFGDCSDPALTLIVQQPTTVAKPANVTVSFKVEDEQGRGIAGLTTANFNIYEDETLISAFEAKPAILPKPGRFSNYTVVLLDLSGSILGSQSLPAVKTAAEKFVTTIVPEPSSADVQVGIWWFDGAAALHSLVPFTSSRAQLVAGIQSLNGNLSNDNSTNLNGAFVAGIDSAFTHSSADKAKNMSSIGSVVLFTDGTDQAARVSRTTVQTRIAATATALKMYTIGLGTEVNGDVLKEYGKDGYFQAADLARLSERFGEVAQAIKDIANSYYLLQYCSPKRAGEHTLRIEALFGKARGSLEAPFSAVGFTGGCTPGA